jgi:hypothetical protein
LSDGSRYHYESRNGGDECLMAHVVGLIRRLPPSSSLPASSSGSLASRKKTRKTLLAE